jgi:hypothetical protein
MSSMTTPLRRLVLVLMITAVGAAVLAWLRDRRSAEAPLDAPAWPPLGPLDGAPAAVATPPAAPTTATATAPAPTTAAGTPAPAAAATDGEHPQWVAPAADGSCPDGYPIKAKDSSGIFHVPEGRSYARTKAERCYATAEAAIADGYRQAKS